MHIELRPLPAVLPHLGDLPPLLTRLYAARGVQQAQELENNLHRLLPAQQLQGIEAAVALLYETLQKQERILIIGDFDADGATATAVAVLGLRLLGAQQVDYLVPNRFTYGYGLTPEIVAVAEQSQPALLITVDNGISSLAGVAAAQAAGMRVLITDHHLAGPVLPNAEAIVNPNQPGCSFASKALAGVGVIFYVLLALRAHLRTQGWFSEHTQPPLANLLDLVALGTVADVAALDANNRILVHQGVARIQAKRARPGILALCTVAGRNPGQLQAADLGFILGPRLNAAGRLEDMRLGIECLLCEDPVQALEMARVLDELNRARKTIEQDMQQAASIQLAELPLATLPYGLCLFEPNWHQGVIGILAARLKERYHRPTIVFAQASDTLLKGSARSVQALHIRDTLEAIATANPGLISTFGGHAMAAGLSIPKVNFSAFQKAFDAAVRSLLSPEDLHAHLLCDGPLSVTDCTLEMARILRQAGPWGQKFPEPLFSNEFVLLEQRLLTEKHLKLWLHIESLDLEAIAFNVDTTQWPNPHVTKVRLVYSLEVNHFRNQERLQLLVRHIQALD